MPEFVPVKTKDFEFVVWTNELISSQNRLERTLSARGKSPSSSHVLLSPPALVAGEMEAISKRDLGEPVFFENKQYDIEFVFNEKLKSFFSDSSPFIEHRLKAVEESFHYSQSSNSLRATINTGNDIGWFKFELVYQIGKEKIRQSFAFEVLPIKMDMASDLDVMNSSIDSQFPLWRFSLAEKTQQQIQAVKEPHPQFLLLWLAQFEALLSDLESGLKHIVNAPHSRLMSTSRAVKMDMLKGKLHQNLEHKVMLAKANGSFEKRFYLNNKKLSVDTPENRFIKFVVSTSILKLSKIIHAAKEMDDKPDKQRLSDSFFNKLDEWQQGMRFFQRQPFFKEVGSVNGSQRESLVLQQKPGYAKVYKAWQQLKWYLDLLEGDRSLSLRSVAELYEVWCFLEVRRILLDLGFEEVKNERARISINDVNASFDDGMKGSFKFEREDGVRLRLAHEPKFTPGGEVLKSWVTTQQPDIFLEATFPHGETVVWLFDAKYRIKKSREFDVSSVGMPDEVPDDAINQMHRYRDAVIHQELGKEGDVIKSRPIFGAYALYPGFFDQEKEENPYKKAIDEVGIGAFSLLPDNSYAGSVWLTDFLTEKLKVKTTIHDVASPDKYFVEEAPRIPCRGTKISRYDDLVIAANQLGRAREQIYIDSFESGQAGFYHTKKLAFDRQSIELHIVMEARYIAVAVDSSADNKREIRFIYPILNAKRIRRKNITFEQSGTNNITDPDELYWLFELGTSFKLNQSVVLDKDAYFQLKLIGSEDISSGPKWSDLVERYVELL